MDQQSRSDNPASCTPARYASVSLDEQEKARSRMACIQMPKEGVSWVLGRKEPGQFVLWVLEKCHINSFGTTEAG
jgi:hypothetical protein